MPVADIAPVEGPLAGYRQGLLDIEKVQQAPLETQKLRAEAGKATLGLANQLRMMQLMSQYGSSLVQQGDTTANVADRFGTLFMESGQPEKALKAFGEASQMRSRAATADFRTSQGVLNRGRAVTQELETYARFMRGAHDQDTFNALNAAYYGATGKIGPLAGQPYDPAKVEEFQRRALSFSETLKEDRFQAIDRFRSRAEAAKAPIQSYREWLRDYRERLLKLRAKAGASVSAMSPSGDEQKEAMRLIKKNNSDYSGDATELSDAGFALASRARELRSQNRALRSEEALARAYTEAESAGEYKHSKATTLFGHQVPGMGAETRYVGGGKAPETAMRWPEDESRRVEGTWYVTPKGVGRFLGLNKDGKPEFESATEEPDKDDPLNDPELDREPEPDEED